MDLASLRIHVKLNPDCHAEKASFLTLNLIERLKSVLEVKKIPSE
jgi:hypothetical protein